MTLRKAQLGMKRMTADDFDKVIRLFPRFTEHKAAIARAVLVDGTAQAVLAREHDIIRQTVSQAVNMVWGAYVETLAPPPDWIVSTVCLPRDKMALVVDIEEEARRNYVAARWESKDEPQ